MRDTIEHDRPRTRASVALQTAVSATTPRDKPSISFCFPVYNDEATVAALTLRAIDVLERVADEYEIVIVDDGSPDRCGEIIDELAARYPQVTAVHHGRNQGYGQAIRSGFQHARPYDWICFTDGDGQYDPAELCHIVKLLPRYDMVVGFRYAKVYRTGRKFMSWLLNFSVRRLFGVRFRDITCGMKLLRREVLESLDLKSKSPFVGGEVTVRAALMGFHIGEVGINTYSRQHGDSSVISWRNIMATVREVFGLRRELFRNRPRRPIQSAAIRDARQRSPVV